jgi:hypothetical protein
MTDEFKPQLLESSARAFQRDIYFYWSTARAHPLSLTKEMRLYQRDLRLVNDALLQQHEISSKNELDVPRLIFMRRLLTQLKLLREHDYTIHALPEPVFFELDSTERVRRTFEHWRDGSFWNELLSVPDLTVRGVDSRLDRVPDQIIEARCNVLTQIADLHLARTAGTHWASISRLLEQVHAVEYEFLLPREYLAVHAGYLRYQSYLSHASPYISYGNAMGWSFLPPIEDEADGWYIVEAGFIRSMLLEPMFWMGLLDIGLLDGVPTAYRLTPIGAWVLDVGPEVELPQEGGRVVVQPNFELFAFDPISDLALAKLDEFAERVRAERAIKYRLTRESVYRAQKRGWSTARIVEVLQEMSQSGEGDVNGKSLPQNIVRTLEEWQSLHERVTIYRRANLLQAADSDLLGRLLEDVSVRQHLSKSVEGPKDGDSTLALISSALGETEELTRALERAGYPALRTRSPQDAVQPALLLDESRLTATGIPVHFDVALPSIYLLEQIVPFSSTDEQGRLHLTPTSIQNAVEQGLPIQDILARLRALHRGPVPHAVERQIRAWGHYYGDAAIEQVTLIQLQDTNTLNELLDEPDIQALLRPFVPDPSHALAVVASERVDELLTVLARYGISIREQLDQAALQTKRGAGQSS